MNGRRTGLLLLPLIMIAMALPAQARDNDGSVNPTVPSINTHSLADSDRDSRLAATAPPASEERQLDEETRNPSITPAAPHSPSTQTSEPSYQRRKPSTILSFGLGQIQDMGKYDLYDRLYGAPAKMVYLQTGYYLYTFGIDIGVSARFGYYSDRGHPLKTLLGLDTPIRGKLPASAVTNPKQNIELTQIPVQALLELAYSPFPVSRRIVLRAWIGPEFLFVQEVLKPNLPANVPVPEGTSLVSKGWNRGLATGAMISISVNGIESRSDYALKSIGIDRTYISPFIEIVKTTSDKMGNSDRKVYGINLSFEGLR